MEMTAAIEALRRLKTAAHVVLFTDSTYLKDGIQKWVHNWQKRNWKTRDNKEVANQDLWRNLIEQTQIHRVEWKWVKGHDTNKYNNFVDELARLAITHRHGADMRLSLAQLEGISR
jgi:ribonuclease HI